MTDGNRDHGRLGSPSPKPTSLYRLFAADGTLLYVGIAFAPLARWKQHGRVKEWWKEVARATLEHFESREAASLAEITAVETEQPLWNIQYRQIPAQNAPTSGEPRRATIAGPSNEHWLSIGEVAERLGIRSDAAVQRIRAWDAPGGLLRSHRLTPPIGTGAAHRRYLAREVDELAAILAMPEGPERDKALDGLRVRSATA